MLEKLYSNDDIMNLTNINRLKNEKSPYLRQHADNPVNWYPWSDKAFEKAHLENKPIFLSIGYSTCHWCHVMEKESFENEQVAKLLNKNFVSIKVDREEHPEIDTIYMDACRTMTNTGGWPLNIIMTPDKKPFFATTYIPKTSRSGKTGMLELIPSIANAWKNRQKEIIESANQTTQKLKKTLFLKKQKLPEKNLLKLLDKTYDDLKKSFDNKNGGFGQEPKFPSPCKLIFLLRYAYMTKNKQPVAMVRQSLKKMRSGGIFDQIGYGFHRYSTDAKWLIPHFEKMLYDQAMLLQVYTECFQITSDVEFKLTSMEIIDYINRSMKSPDGVFFTAQDADSGNMEGKFYLWTEKELSEALSQSEFTTVKEYFNLRQDGNFIPPTSQKTDGKNIIFFREDTFNNRKILKPILLKLYKFRNMRPRPFTDKKILCSWNALMINALTKAGIAFQNPLYIKEAEKAIDFILQKLYKNKKLSHSYIDYTASKNANLNDYAFMINALISLYEATDTNKYLKLALTLNKTLETNFLDKKSGAYFLTSYKVAENLPVHTMNFFDGAIPAGNSVQMLNLIKLFHITSETKFIKQAFKIFNSTQGHITQNPTAYSMLLSALMFEKSNPIHLTILTSKKSKIPLQEFLNIINSYYIPNKTIIIKKNDSNNNNIIEKKTIIYACANSTCLPPFTSLNELKNFLKDLEISSKNNP